MFSESIACVCETNSTAATWFPATCKSGLCVLDFLKRDRADKAGFNGSYQGLKTGFGKGRFWAFWSLKIVGIYRRVRVSPYPESESGAALLHLEKKLEGFPLGRLTELSY